MREIVERGYRLGRGERGKMGVRERVRGKDEGEGVRRKDKRGGVSGRRESG